MREESDNWLIAPLLTITVAYVVFAGGYPLVAATVTLCAYLYTLWRLKRNVY